jgi:hypothetical protein
VAVIAVSCSVREINDLTPGPRDGAAGTAGGAGGTVVRADGGPGGSSGGGGGPVIDAPVAPPTMRPNGTNCTAAADCASGFCADGICCNTACTQTCSSCAVPGRMGTCSFVPEGMAPRNPAGCAKEAASTCGLDGTCDGEGQCRKHPQGTECSPGRCMGTALVGVGLCDGKGACEANGTMNCAPFGCNPGGGATRAACFQTCTADAQCADGQRCVNGSCGKKARGMPCARADECVTGVCADGVCCESACTGPCVSCNQTGRAGACLPVPAGSADPRGQCRDEGQTTCGRTGVCDGNGGCARYAAGAVCRAGACEGGNWNAEWTCDGAGLCRRGSTLACAPFVCGPGGCLARCSSDRDCAAGRTCTNGSCGLKPIGQTCASGAECASRFCADGVCCNEACTDACRSCALATSRGSCRPVPAGTLDPRRRCVDMGATTCGTDGRCAADGTCSRYGTSTLCRAERCMDGVYVPASRCDGRGTCPASPPQDCDPYVCNGNRCFDSCSSNAACAEPNTCAGGSCGTKMNGAVCSKGSECTSGFCAQGVCCEAACTGACRACNLSGNLGKCLPVPDGGTDPNGMCSDEGVASCGRDGKCDGKGACRRYAAGSVCKAAACPSAGATFTAASTCDGAGTCVAGKTSSCAPYRCDGTTCRDSCSTDADCQEGTVCNNGSCGKKPLGGSCTAGADCGSGHCVDGVCCATDACGTCQACNVAGQAGQCAAIPAGQPDTANRCPMNASNPCGNTGLCNGAGGCQVVSAGTQCGPATCTGSTRVGPSTCDGAGACKPGPETSCAPYTCDTNGTCRTRCQNATHCTNGGPCRGNGRCPGG